MSAVVPKHGPVRQLDRRPDPFDAVTELDVQDPTRLLRRLNRMAESLAMLERRWWPKRVEFEGIACGPGGARVRLPHELGGNVRYVVRRWYSPAGLVPALHLDAEASDSKTLVLRSYVSGVATLELVQGG